MMVALEQARRGLDAGQLPIGAVIVHNDVVIGAGCNRIVAESDLLAHAEMEAIEDAKPVLSTLPLAERKKVVLYATLEPCLMCCGALMNLNVGHVCFALHSPGDGVIPMLHKWHKRSNHMPAFGPPELIAPVQQDGSRELFRAFAKRFPSSRFAKWTQQLSEHYE